MIREFEEKFIRINIISEDEIAIEEKYRHLLCVFFNCSEKDLPTYVWESRETIRKEGGLYV